MDHFSSLLSHHSPDGDHITGQKSGITRIFCIPNSIICALLSPAPFLPILRAGETNISERAFSSLPVPPRYGARGVSAFFFRENISPFSSLLVDSLSVSISAPREKVPWVDSNSRHRPCGGLRWLHAASFAYGWHIPCFTLSPEYYGNFLHTRYQVRTWYIGS